VTEDQNRDKVRVGAFRVRTAQRVVIHRANTAACGNWSTPQGVPMMGKGHRRSGVSTRPEAGSMPRNDQAMNITRLIDPDAINRACVRPSPAG
jgi:hypothetical protein